VSVDHAQAVGALPWHHRDPFDRLLVAQANLEDAILVTNDERLSSYGAQVAW
jgi:PIN domain nuclease of toxin-antitoxin system